MAQHPKTVARIEALIEDLAPPSPPCFDFHNRDAWRQYLRSACESTAGEARKWKTRPPQRLGPFIKDENRDWTKNTQWTFCADCTHNSAQRVVLAKAGRCKPAWWEEHAGRVIKLVVVK